MKDRLFFNENWNIIAVLILYTILAIFSFKYFQYAIGGDEISYIDVAHSYFTGQWGTAINGYWSPLYSWIITPFLIFGTSKIDMVYISKIVSLIIGFFTIIIIRNFYRKFKISKLIGTSILFASIPSILYFSFVNNAPDLLLAAILIYYLSIIFSPEYSNSYINGLFCGFVGVLAYLTKSFAFPFFIVHFILFNLIFYIKSVKFEKKKILKNMFLGLSIFFLLSGVWVGVISEKYGELTISTSGDYNHALVGPEYQANNMGCGLAPIYYIGLIIPPNNYTSIWDDLSYQKLNPWNTFGSLKNFDYELKLIWSNIIYTFQIIIFLMPIDIFIFISMILFIIKSKSFNVSDTLIKYLLLTMLIYIGGYCLIIPEWRYLWFIFIILMISSFYMVDRWYKNHIFNVKIRNILLVLLIIAFVTQPIIEESGYYTSTNDKLYNLSSTLNIEYGVHGNIASNDQWMKTLTLAYYLNSKYYGMTKITTNSTDLQHELEINNINYYFVYSSSNIPTLTHYHDITNGKLDGMKIYVKN